MFLQPRAARALLALFVGPLLVGLGLAAPAAAQAPKVGDYYEDSTDIGFKIKTPEDWEFTPPQPNEDELIGRYTPPFNTYILLAPDEPLFLEVNLIKFDRRPEPGEEQDEEGGGDPASIEDLKEWIEDNMRARGIRLDDEDDRKIDGVEAVRCEFVGKVKKEEFRVFAVLYHIRPDVDVAIIGNGPGDRGDWRKYEGTFRRLEKSFKTVEVEKVEFSGAREGDSAIRTKKRRELEAECAKNPGWELHETDNYFVITDNDDREFIEELMDRLEAIRAVYEEIYPWEEAERIRAQAAQRRAEEEKEKDDDELDEEEARERARREAMGQEGRTTTGISSRELSRTSVVRIFKNRKQYHEYGGPRGSAGYWHNGHEELVIYDDQAGGGRRDTWAVLNHEAFHQYIFYLYGSLSPHSWYNEGSGDYFSGYEYRHKRFRLKPFAWRVETIKQAIKDDDAALDEGRDRKIVPLKDLVRYTQREYYGQNDYGIGGGQNYAQGWSLIYFLRTGEENNADGWKDEWNDILDVYFTTLAATEDLDEAVDQAFAGVDWDEFEMAWKEYILREL